MLQDPTKTTVDTIADCMAPSDRGQVDQSASGRTYTTFTTISIIYVLVLLTHWRQLLPYGYSYKASCARPG